MSFDLRRIAEAQKKSVAFVENAEQRRILEQFVESAGALVEAAARDALQELADEINSQLAPGARVRLVQEGSKVVPEVVSLGNDSGRARTLAVDSETISKVLVRMPSDVKAMAADAAQKAGTSLNNWTVNILERALVNLRERQEATSRTNRPGESNGSGAQEPREQGEDGTVS